MKKDNKKLIYKFFKFFSAFLFVIFITLYLSASAGYYEYSNNKQMTFTKKQIEKFEKDVKSGKNIDLNKYMTNTNKNYNTVFSKMGFSLSNFISENISTGVEKFFSIIIKLVDEK